MQTDRSATQAGASSEPVTGKREEPPARRLPASATMTGANANDRAVRRRPLANSSAKQGRTAMKKILFVAIAAAVAQDSGLTIMAGVERGVALEPLLKDCEVVIELWFRFSMVAACGFSNAFRFA